MTDILPALKLPQAWGFRYAPKMRLFSSVPTPQEVIDDFWKASNEDWWRVNKQTSSAANPRNPCAPSNAEKAFKN
jgi:hypothetical protein